MRASRSSRGAIINGTSPPGRESIGGGVSPCDSSETYMPSDISDTSHSRKRVKRAKISVLHVPGIGTLDPITGEQVEAGVKVAPPGARTQVAVSVYDLRKEDDVIFDGIRLCANKCEFCYVHQMPKGFRKSLYMMDDDFRTSFLYGSFVTLTNLTDGDVQRILDENLSPLYVSVHTTDT